MCEPKNGIRLCTCGAKELNKRSMWVLYSEGYIIGKFVAAGFGSEVSGIRMIFDLLLFVLLLPFYALLACVMLVLLVFFSIGRILPYDWQEKYNSIFVPRKANYIAKQLNAGNAFDFPYQPKDGDILMVRWGWRKYYFDYRVPSHPLCGGWQVLFAYDANRRLKSYQTQEKMRGFAKLY